MKVIKADVYDDIIFNTIEDIDTGIVTGITSVLKLPTGNLNNILIDFNFINTKLPQELNIFATFDIDEKRCIDVEVKKITVDGITYENACYIPAEVFENPCYFMLGLYGFALQDENKIKQRISLVPLKNIVVKGSYDPNSKESITPTPSIFEEYFEKIDKATEELKNTMITYQKYETSYTTTKANETTIPINIEEYIENEGMLFVKINGLDLIETVEYTVAGNQITLVNAVDKDTVIHIIYLKPMKEDIKNLGYKIEEQQEELDALYNDFKPNTVSGESAIVSDGVKGSKVEVIGDGNSYQETTEGAQLLDISASHRIGETGKANGVDYTVNKDGSISFKGTATGGNAWFKIRGGTLNKETDTNYTYKCFGLPNEVYTNIYQVGNKYGEAIATFSVGASNVKDYTMAIIISEGTTVDFTARPFLVEGTYTESTLPPYEPYTNGASPNTEYEQDIEVIEAYNLLDTRGFKVVTNYNVITCDINENGELIINGTTGSNGDDIRIRSQEPLISLSAGDYIFDFKTTENTSNIFNTEINLKSEGLGTYLLVKRLAENISYKQLNLTEDLDIYNISIHLPPNTTYTNYIIKPMIYSGTEVKPYLPYGHIGLVQRKQGLFNAEFRQGSVSQVGRTDRLFSTQELKFETTKTYSVLTNLDLSKYKYALALATNKFPTDSFFYDSAWITQRTFTFSTTQEGYFGIGIARVDNTALTPEEMTNYYFIVDEVENATELEPIVHSIDLAGNTLAKVGDIKDLLNIGMNGSVKIGDKVIKKYVFTGDENWLSASSVAEGTTRFYFEKTDVKNNKNIYSEHKNVVSNRFKSLSWYEIYQTDKSTIAGISGYDDSNTSGHRIVIRIDSNVASTVEELKAYLKANETYCYYVSTETETIDLPSISPIKLFNGTNVFELVTNLGTTLSVTYKVSNNSRLEALEKAVLEIGGNE